MIKVDHLYKSFGQNKVVNGVSMGFINGEVSGVIGKNGAEKTTLFRCIASLESFKGNVYADKNPLKDYLGVLFAENFFFKRIAGREYIRLLCTAREVDCCNIDERNIFGLPLDKYASTYSTGMIFKKIVVKGWII